VKENNMNKLFYVLLLSLFVMVGAHAQTIEGDWQGTLRAGATELRLVLHVTKDEKGALRATFDSVDQNAMGIPITSISFNDSILKFEIQNINGSYEGKANADRTVIDGTWSQGGGSLPLELTRVGARTETKKKTLKPSDIDGTWEGVLDAGAEKLRIVLHILTYEDGMMARLDSPDQNSFGIPITTISREGTKLKFELKQIGGSYDGSFNPELTTVSGTWEQGGGTLPLVLKRTSPASKEKK
jgi:hypothetical protein